MPQKFDDLTGRKFGVLTVIKKLQKETNGDHKWLCICDCGTECVKRGRDLRAGRSTRCGYNCTADPRNEKKPIRKTGRKGGFEESLCFSCIRSAAPPELQCVWDKSRAQILPDGVIYRIVDGCEKPKTIVINCPEFLSMYDENNAELLRQARERNKNSKVIELELKGPGCSLVGRDRSGR